MYCEFKLLSQITDILKARGETRGTPSNRKSVFFLQLYRVYKLYVCYMKQNCCIFIACVCVTRYD